ncbi:divergent polysaccharide deacetylase family protein [Litoreibacter arenae]|uniref:Divergent polysaccharide deacetylase n=1 Tax=Litoreibacter arenae DSM 19593 TaxID=1123360 RepID=S9RLJ8_9RHOB|nr:divergent polysaccharide deacetylase family protein [Litoreibacter arenae]EPX78995.1 hypothetical protein thalar_01812 [Litoreibacter arenae DSM 19593]
MGKGLGAGLVSGGFVGAVVMAMLSLYAPLPQDRIDAAPKINAEKPEPVSVAPESGASSAAPRVEENASLPATASQSEAAATSEVARAPQQTGTQTLNEQQDAPVVQPTVAQPETAEATRSDSPAAPVVGTDTQISQTTPDAPALKADGDDAIVIARVDPAPSAALRVDEATPLPSADAAPNVEADPQTATLKVQPSTLPSTTVVGTEQPDPDAMPRASSLPTIGSDAPEEGDSLDVASADTPITLPRINSGVVTNRLPSVGDAAPEPEAERAEVAPAPVEDLGALRNFAAQVDGIEGKSLFGVILIDSGEDGIPREDLMKLSIPVTIAIDPTAADAASTMQAYRDAGMEVVAIANELPTSAGPGDVAVAVEAYFNILDQAVGLMDPLDGRIQSNRTLLQPVLGAIRNSGHGLITFDRGLNTAQQAARRENIPAATVFRVLDGELEEAPKIKRYLDRAAFNANRDGAVVVVGRSYPDTVKALVEWVLEKKEAGIAMVPVSAVMLADDAP